MSKSAISRRLAVGQLGAAAALAGLGGADRAAAHVATPVAGGSPHPLVGTWMTMTAAGIVPVTFGVDGSFVAVFTANAIDPALGLRFQGPALGHWQPIGEHSGHFTGIQVLTDEAGVYAGTWTFEGHPLVSEDHQTYIDDAPRHVTIRDAANAITDDQVAPVVPPITGTRVGASPDSLVFPPLMPALP